MAMLEIKNLQKRFGEKEVLKGLDLSVPEGAVFGFRRHPCVRFEILTEGKLLRKT